MNKFGQSLVGHVVIDALDEGDLGYWIRFDRDCDLRIWNRHHLDGGLLTSATVVDVVNIDLSLTISLSNGSRVMIDLSDEGGDGPEAFMLRTPDAIFVEQN